jgi:hypothetical protein
MIEILVVATFLVFLIRDSIKAQEELAAFCARCAAAEAFLNWRQLNPGVYIGLSLEGRKLVLDLLKAYDWFLRTHPHLKDGEGRHREYIESLLDDLPPKDPKIHGLPKKGVRTNAFFINLLT